MPSNTPPTPLSTISLSTNKALHGKKDADGVPRFMYIPFDYTTKGLAADAFYGKVEKTFQDMQKQGRLGVLVNNVGITNAHPMELQEFDDQFVEVVSLYASKPSFKTLISDRNPFLFVTNP
jgi:NAD(P)-dependent dehydrogenase (short-subunit alcohol dehydrogenase family)